MLREERKGRTVSTQKVPQVDPSPPIHIGKFAPLSLPKIPTKSETFDPPHFRPADGRPTPLQPFRLRLQGFRSVGLPSAPPTLRAGPDHTPPQIISNQTIPDPPRLSRRGTTFDTDKRQVHTMGSCLALLPSPVGSSHDAFTHFLCIFMTSNLGHRWHIPQ